MASVHARPGQEWAGTIEDRHDLHRFDERRQALCNPEIRTYSRITKNDAYREPYMTLRTRQEIEDSGFAHLYRFCDDCSRTHRGLR